ncbi:aspartate/glutamate racemase family protein [uncultured Roseobacter sp.]|uniref:aspartate/glutamate racemase family protein n=1 Tax=uncultured Roseobacter sp. TaxID=114847 RepID=UPI002629EFD7|nr:aspartate/glutamate racemase family protein [uncultured Roseobacter sp.]
MTKTDPALLGILMLDTRFPRIPGDVGNPDTWLFPVRYAIVPGATPQAVVCEDPEPFVRAFVTAGEELVSQGCRGIATTCGFLSLIRPRLARELGVPVAASALEQAGQIQATLGPGKRIGILTISGPSLTPEHLSVAGVPQDAEVQGVEETAFAHSILGNADTLDVPKARQDLTEAARKMVQDTPDIGAIILECTNMVPYAPDIARATGRPVYSIYSYLNWFHESLAPRGFTSQGHAANRPQKRGC